VWFGGLIYLLALVRRRRAADDEAGAVEAVHAFSSLALKAVAVVAVAGGILGWIEVGGLDPLTSTTYGKLLLVKVALVLVVIALAAWNRQRILPGMRLDSTGEAPVGQHAVSLNRLLRVVAAEVLVLCLVLGATAVLTNVTPAKAALQRGPVSVNAPIGDGTMDVVVDPAKPGRNDIHVYFKDQNGQADDQYPKATFRLSLPSKGIPVIERPGVASGPGHFLLVGTQLPLAGTWTLTVVVQPDKFHERTGTVTFPVR